ncbi:TonB-dependent receptor [Pedobacter metabolipauper]|uniref:TonB-linked SusC/RagA family outer membrane protein n=1 Tax=Pedobacter metabolipauper TaxID=425513 RepID=A0A4R6SXE5_9SPHI|nr:TonB-dependent receptor [Pedobacter metabolipauper]TDQ11194.1 TonB-linked SusC/RagA family outer membrane protein [Pedobacter metabolipauper]
MNRLLYIFIAFSLLHVSSPAFAQKISLSVTNASITDVISEIKKQTNIDFLYNNRALKNARPISIHCVNMELRPALDLCFEQQPFEYKIKNNTVMITRKKNRMQAADPILEPWLRLQGTVKDSVTAQILEGVSISVEGTGTGTRSDAMGNFIISAPEQQQVIVVSYLGYATQRIQVSSRLNMEVNLVREDTRLNEVVVIGYGTSPKGSVTGAISSVQSAVFENRPLNNSLEALQGTIPGLTVTRSSGQPGNQNYAVQIRGYSSINGNIPLILIDGILGDINTINPNDISEVSVLKDAAASIYGARAADGVMLISTKNGRKGPPEVSYTMNTGIKEPSYLRKISNTLHFAEFMNEGLLNVGMTGFPRDVFDKIKANAAPDLNGGWNYGITSYPGFYGYTDWNKAIYKNSLQQLHNLSVSGGTENNSYLVSLGYNQDDGAVKFGENRSDRYNMRLNYNFQLFKDLTFESRTSFENQAIVSPTMLANALTNVTRQFPYQPVYNALGQFYGYQGYENPAQTLQEAGDQHANHSRFNTNLKLEYKLLDGLKLTGQAAFKLDYTNDNAINRTFTRHNYTGEIQDIRNTPNSAYYANAKMLNKSYQVYFDYDRQLAHDHQITLTAGASLEQTKNEGQAIMGYNFPGNDIFTLNLADRTKVAYADFTGNLNNQALASYFGRLRYAFRQKMMLDLTARADVSSKFAASKRWSAIFPSAAFAYNLSEERFIKTLNTFDQLKFRLSWGKAGNQEIGNLGLYDYVSLISIVTNGSNNPLSYPIGFPNAGLVGAVSKPASPNRTWETIENKNIGIDGSVFRSRLTFSFDYFNKINSDMLVDIALPATFGGNVPSSNQGKLETKGFETIWSWKDNIADFKYSISLQLSDSKNKLVQLRNSDSYREGLNRFRQGYSIYSYFGYVYEGIIKTQDQLDRYKQLLGVPSRIGIGDVMYKDVDGDGKLTAFGDLSKGLSGDMTYLGNLLPRYNFSSNINLSYKQMDLGIFLQGVGKRNVQYEGSISTPNAFFWPSLEYYYGKTYSPERPNAEYPRYLPGSVGYDDIREYNYRTSALTMQNVAYLRFKVITLGYSLPARMASKIKMKSLRVYLSGQDLFTLSKGTLGGNFDPEDGYRNEGTYPFSKVYSFGLNLKF